MEARADHRRFIRDRSRAGEAAGGERLPGGAGGAARGGAFGRLRSDQRRRHGPCAGLPARRPERGGGARAVPADGGGHGGAGPGDLRRGGAAADRSGRIQHGEGPPDR